MINFFRINLAMAVFILLSGCAIESYTLKKSPNEYVPVPPRLDLIGTNYKAIDQLISQVNVSLPTGSKIIVSSVVNINQLENVAPLGRVISEHVLGRFAQFGYGVIELKIRNQIYMKRHEGELLLTREIRELVRAQNAHAFIVGTYAEASDRVFVSLKVIEADGSRILGAVDYSIEKNAVVKSLLGNG
jgi:TolB-like protein